MAKFLDEDGLLYFWGKLKTMFGGKVDKVDGKGLSANDYTTDEKLKLAAVEEGANKTTIDSILSTTSEHAIQNGVVATALNNKVEKVDGKGLSTNDYTTEEKTKLAGFSSASDYALKTDITGLYNIKGSVNTVDDLPANPTKGDVYDVLSSGMNYVWTGEKWDELGGNVTVDTIPNTKIDEIVNS